MRKRFIEIIVTSKDDKEDWRSFIHCSDGDVKWELRGYGDSPGVAANDAWKCYQDDIDNWAIYGHAIESRCKECGIKYATNGRYYCLSCETRG